MFPFIGFCSNESYVLCGIIRLQGITKSISRYPTYRRRFENSVKAISEELERRNANGRGSESTFGRMFSNQGSFRTKTSNREDDQEVERDVDVV